MTTSRHLVADVIHLVRRPVDVELDQTYHEIGIRSFGKGIFHKPPVSGSELGGKRVFWIEPGDLVFSNVFAWEGAVARATSDERGFIGSHRFMTYRVHEQIADADYLRYFFTSDKGLDVIQRASPGSAGRNKTLGINTFASQSIELPTIDEQQRVAAKLDRAFRDIYQASELRVRTHRLHGALLESLIEEVGSRASCQPVRIGDILRLERKTTPVTSGHKYIPIGIRSFGRGIFHYPPTAAEELSILRYYKFPVGSLALSNIKAWEGAIATTTESDVDAIASNRFLFYLPRTGQLDVRFMQYYLLSRSGLRKIGSASPGSADRNRTLSIKSFENIEIELPSIDEQRRVAGILNRVRQTTKLAEHQESVVGALRQSLLNAAFSGQL